MKDDHSIMKDDHSMMKDDHSIMKDDHSMKDDNDVRSIKPTTSSRGMNRFHFRTGKI